MTKTESIARKILGWKLNRWDRWYDSASGFFIPISEFQPEQNLEHAMIIVERLKNYGFTYTAKGTTKVCFNHFCDTGDTLAEAITNAAFLIADSSSSLADEWQ